MKTAIELSRRARVADFMRTFREIKDTDLLVLKAHVLIEFELREYLAFRLSLPPQDIPSFEDRTRNLGFHHLANIALAGDDHRDLLTIVSKLNDVRTEIAHRMDPETYRKKLASLNDAVWGGHTKAPEDLHLATITSLANIWGQIVRRHTDGRYGEGTFENIMP